MKKEIWKDIEEYKGLYQVSNLGKIKSLARNTKNQYSYQERLLKEILDKDGYCVINLHNGCKVKTHKVHRLVANAFLGKKENLEVNHKDGNKKNNCVENLEWCTSQENTIHAFNKKLFIPKCGKDCKNSKAVIIKKDNYIKKFDTEKLASEFLRVRPSAINNCLKKRNKKCKGYEVFYE